MSNSTDPLSPRAVAAGVIIGLVVTILGGIAVHRLTRDSSPGRSVAEPHGRIGSEYASPAAAQGRQFGPNLEQEMNEALSARTGYRYRVLTDQSSRLGEYDLENFVKPQRKEFRFYPYLTVGDFDGDGVSDLAAQVKNVENNQERLAVLWGHSRALTYYDGQLCDAISFVPANEWKSHWEELSITLAADAILIECYEKSAWMLYWTGRSFERYWVSD